ncbi:MAG: hypothetical protein IJV47_05515 [Candidatus Methanomethylophilaceae archaeon]|nr:hypothetical protein [Candidatus Methanomethylophilaceae archaeon]MBQ9690046.1 hypothetical protein [Candidatus Methanomethylophilaceae archaeon]
MGQAWTAALIWSEKHGKKYSHDVEKVETFFAHDYVYEYSYTDSDGQVRTGTSINGYKLMETSYKGNQLVNDFIKEMVGHRESPVLRAAWIGEYYDGSEFEDGDYHSLIDAVNSPWEMSFRHEADDDATFEPVVICCDELRQYIRCTPDPGKEDLEIASLPLLCAVGNGLGGGDYYGSRIELVGSWAFKPLTLRNEEPGGYDDLTDVFVEEREE